MKKKVFALAMSVVVAFGLTVCGNASKPPTIPGNNVRGLNQRVFAVLSSG
ncbi:MAG: hypothetical protein IJQ74_07485 [Synergistaceae bacterium]|nr:hypothetical protein [Synergistaceae bacterium]MBQ6920158.1 hypothetical protein [Synergistaceae bacterium]MBQ6971685.1 hypothetical protein [Synergistaceae bacterium]